jgi:hypothetical protein
VFFQSVTARGDTDQPILADIRSVSPSFLETAALRLLEGRFFRDSDIGVAPRVVVLNDVAARQLFSNRQAVGQSITWSGEATVVGIVGRVRQLGPEAEPRPELYVPFEQAIAVVGSMGMLAVLAHIDGPAERVKPAVLAALSPIVPPMSRVPAPHDLEATFREMTAHRRFSAGVMSMFGALALLIGAMGVYSIVAFTVAQRAREIGVRLALGATQRAVMRSVLCPIVRCLFAGLTLGGAGAWGMSRLFTSAVYGVAPTDGLVIVTVVATVTATVLIASVPPAMRAAKVEPVRVLRG